eukprot:15361557-Ditylum_brightwellii.AAC.1
MMNRGQKRCHGKSQAKSDSDEIPPPKRFLTCYNFFFKHERAAFLKAQSDAALINENNPLLKKTGEKKKGAKANFSKFSTEIAAKWKGLSSEEKKIYENMANDDLARYQRDYEVYRTKTTEKKKKQNQK